MGTNSTQTGCLNCKNFLKLTETEARRLEPRLEEVSQKLPLVGACMHPVREPRRLIRKFVFYGDPACELFFRGFFTEKTGVKCPQCKVGDLVVTRPTIQNQTVILIGCNQYPKCRLSVRQLTLKTRCRFCNTPLRLSGGNILDCTCPNCNRGVTLPVALKTWPGLAKPDGGCVHFENETNCELCDTSRHGRKSLLELDLVNYKLWHWQLRSRPPAQPTVQRRSVLSIDSTEDATFTDNGWEDDELEESDEAEMDAWDDRKNFIIDYHTILDEESDGDWFAS